MVIKRIIFFGTSEFAVPSLKLLYSNKYDIVLVVSQSDQPKGRGQKLVSPPIKVLAKQLNIECIQPEIIKDNNFHNYLRKKSPDVIIVISYGKILPSEILKIPPYGCINVHASLLPKYRGAAPIQWTILMGEKQAGVSTMYMNEKMDEGDILLQQSVDLIGNETASQLNDILSNIGANLLIKTLKMIEEKTLIPKPQDHSIATYAPKIKKEDGLIDWNQTASYIERMIRAFQPWPSAYCYYKNKLIKIYEAEVGNLNESNALPSIIVEVDKNFIIVKCGNNTFLKIKKLQLEGKKILSTKEFLSGNKVFVGDKLVGK